MKPSLNTSNPAIKRILSEVKKLIFRINMWQATAAVEDNLFDWHFVLRGPQDTPFEGGLFHGRIILPAQVGKKICLSISQHHPELWQPGWDIRTALTAIQSFMPTPGNGAIAALDYNDEERRNLARKSLEASKNSLRACNMLDSFSTILSSERPPSSSSGAAAAGAVRRPVTEESASNSTENKPDETRPDTKPEKETDTGSNIEGAHKGSSGAGEGVEAGGTESQTDKMEDDTAPMHGGLRHRKHTSEAAQSPTQATAQASSSSSTSSAPTPPATAAAARPTYAPPTYAPHAARAGAAVQDRQNTGGVARASGRTQGGTTRREPDIPPSEDERALGSLANFLTVCIVFLVTRRGLMMAFPEVDWETEVVTWFKTFCECVDGFITAATSPHP